MKVSECMTREVCLVDPEDTLQDAARKMAEADAGVLPVRENDRLVGMITDRDIAIRGVALARAPQAHVREIMSDEVCYCFEDDDTDAVLDNMADIQVRRLPVVNREKRLVGIISIGDLACRGERAAAGDALGDIARPSRLHAQAI